MSAAADQRELQAKGCAVLLLIGAAAWAWFHFTASDPATSWRSSPQPMGGFNYSAIIDPGADPLAIERLAREHCAPKAICTVYAWSGADDRAQALPMLERERKALAFRYDVNRETGFERSAWDCSRFKRAITCL